MSSLDRLTDIRTGHTVCAICLECIDCGLCKCGKRGLDFKHIEHAIKEMGTQSKLYKIVKHEIKRRGHWKNLPRGK